MKYAVALALFALPVAADEALEIKLQELETRIAKIRAEAKQDQEDRAKVQARIAEIEATLAAAKKKDQTALGAGKLDDLRAEKRKLEDALRGGRNKTTRAARRLEGNLKEIEVKREPVDLDALINAARKGDKDALARLAKIRQQINQAVPAPMNHPQMAGFVQLGNRVQIINGRGMAIGLGNSAAPAPKSKAKPAAKPKKEIPADVRKKQVAEDLTDQEKRSAALEKQIVEMTRKVLELEERLRDLKQKVAQAERG